MGKSDQSTQNPFFTFVEQTHALSIAASSSLGSANALPGRVFALRNGHAAALGDWWRLKELP